MNIATNLKIRRLGTVEPFFFLCCSTFIDFATLMLHNNLDNSEEDKNEI